MNRSDDTAGYTACPQTPRTTLRAGCVGVLVWCKGGCRHQAPADRRRGREQEGDGWAEDTIGSRARGRGRPKWAPRRPPPEKPPPDVAAPPPPPLTRSCQWPLGEKRPFTLCGKPIVGRGPYCAVHTQLPGRAAPAEVRLENCATACLGWLVTAPAC